MTESRAKPITDFEDIQTTREAATKVIAQTRALQDVLEVFAPHADDAHLDYAELLQRTIEVLQDEARGMTGQTAPVSGE